MITSTQNEQIKKLKKLKAEKNILCLDNPKLLQEAIDNKWEVLYVLKTENVNKTFLNEDILVSDNVLKAFTNTVTSQGVVALVKFKYESVKPPSSNFLVLDHVQDPGNVGTLIRSAVGADFKDIYLINCAKVCLDKTVRSSMGSIFKCNLYEVDENFYDTLKNWNKELLIADMFGENLYNTEIEGNVGVVVGNEGHGISEQMKQIATKKISLPMKNNLESLNAGVSGSIIMYHLAFGGKNVRS